VDGSHMGAVRPAHADGFAAIAGRVSLAFEGTGAGTKPIRK